MNDWRYIIDLIKILSNFVYSCFSQIYVPKIQGYNASRHDSQMEAGVDSIQTNTLDVLQMQKQWLQMR